MEIEKTELKKIQDLANISVDTFEPISAVTEQPIKNPQ